MTQMMQSASIRFIKNHMFDHCCECGVNPRHVWNYTDESEIGMAALMAESLHARTIAAEVIGKGRIERYGSLYKKTSCANDDACGVARPHRIMRS